MGFSVFSLEVNACQSVSRRPPTIVRTLQHLPAAMRELDLENGTAKEMGCGTTQRFPSGVQVEAMLLLDCGRQSFPRKTLPPYSSFALMREPSNWRSF